MTELEALKMALEWFRDCTDGRPSEEEREAALILKRMYQERTAAHDRAP